MAPKRADIRDPGEVSRAPGHSQTDRNPMAERVRDSAASNSVSNTPDEKDAVPVYISPVFWSLASQVSTVGIFVLLLFVFLEQARPILVPLMSAAVIGLMLGPIHAFLRRYDVPAWASALLLTLLFVVLVNAFITLMAAPAIDWVQKAPEIGKTIKEKLQVLDRPLASLRELQKALMSQGGGDGRLEVNTGGPDLLAPAMSILTPAIGQLLLFIGTLFFFLLGRDELRRYLVNFYHGREQRLRTLRIMNDIERSLTRYLSTVAVIYAVMGIMTGIMAFAVGLPSPLVFGLLAFVLNFVPYIGPSLVMVVLTGVGLITFPTIAHALIAPAVYLGMATLEGHFVTPSIIGRTLTLSPMMVFLALAFWTYIWGPVGAFLAVPLLIVALVSLQHIRPKAEMNLPG